MRPFFNIYLIFSCVFFLIAGHSFQSLHAQQIPQQSSFYFESVDLPLGEFDRHINTIAGTIV